MGLEIHGRQNNAGNVAGMIAACNTHAAEAPRASYRPVLGAIDVKSVFYVFYFGHVFTFLTFIFQTFFI